MSFFQSRFRGFRIIELAAFVCVIALAFGVYLAKTNAGRERSKIATIERQIAEERRKLKMLRAEVAHLEQPERLEQLSTQHLGLQAVDGAKEAVPEALPDIANPAEKGALNAVPLFRTPPAAMVAPATTITTAAPATLAAAALTPAAAPAPMSAVTPQ
jgi:cell division protein FtsL